MGGLGTGVVLDHSRGRQEASRCDPVECPIICIMVTETDD
jgi:hypothetical protein